MLGLDAVAGETKQKLGSKRRGQDPNANWHGSLGSSPVQGQEKQLAAPEQASEGGGGEPGGRGFSGAAP